MHGECGQMGFAPTRYAYRPVNLVLSAEAYLHWMFLANGPKNVEASAFGITRKDNPFYVERLWVPKQEGSAGFTSPDEGELNEMVEWAADNEIDPTRVGKVWLHTHPGDSPHPSSTDEDSFRDRFAVTDWAFMAITGKSGITYCRIRMNGKNPCQFVIDVATDWYSVGTNFADWHGRAAGWLAEYNEKVRERVWQTWTGTSHGAWRSWEERRKEWDKEAEERRQKSTGYRPVSQTPGADTGGRKTAGGQSVPRRPTYRQIRQDPAFRAWIETTYQGVKKVEHMSRREVREAWADYETSAVFVGDREKLGHGVPTRLLGKDVFDLDDMDDEDVIDSDLERRIDRLDEAARARAEYGNAD